jgi:glucose/arabinose dehydrogenase
MNNVIIARTLLINFALCTALLAQTATPASTNQQSSPSSPSQPQPAAPSAKPSGPVLPQRYRQNRFAARARQYYALTWGVDSLTVRSAESGEIIRFSYRVLDADKAKALNDKKTEPSLIDPKAGVKLVVPSLEKIGKLRQSSTPEDGKMYWMAFSNKGGFVKPGHRVNVVIGQFRAEGLIVQ